MEVMAITSSSVVLPEMLSPDLRGMTPLLVTMEQQLLLRGY